MKEAETKRCWYLKRLNKKRPSATTITELCDCCNKEAYVELHTYKIDNVGKRVKKEIRLCKNHFETIEKFLEAFNQ